MTKTKKIIALVLAFVLVISITVVATVAFLTDKTTVAKNTFTLGKVDIVLTEYVVDETGAKDTTKTRTETGNTTTYDGTYGYRLMPGVAVDKDPMVTVIKGSEDCYVRMKVTLDNASKFAKIYQAYAQTTSTDVEDAISAMKAYFVGYDDETWVFADSKLENDKLTVTFNYKEVVKKTAVDAATTSITTYTGLDLTPIITGVKLPEWVTSEMAADLPNFSVDVVAEAIQAASFDDADAAWAAFDAQTPVSGQGATDPATP